MQPGSGNYKTPLFGCLDCITTLKCFSKVVCWLLCYGLFFIAQLKLMVFPSAFPSYKSNQISSFLIEKFCHKKSMKVTMLVYAHRKKSFHRIFAKLFHIWVFRLPVLITFIIKLVYTLLQNFMYP